MLRFSCQARVYKDFVCAHEEGDLVIVLQGEPSHVMFLGPQCERPVVAKPPKPSAKLPFGLSAAQRAKPKPKQKSEKPEPSAADPPTSFPDDSDDKATAGSRTALQNAAAVIRDQIVKLNRVTGCLKGLDSL